MSASKRRPLGSSFGAAKDLKKASPKQFSGVKSKLRTGSHAGNLKPKVDRSREPFRRIGRNTLAKYVKASQDNEESIYDERAQSDMLSITTINDSAEMDLRQRIEETEYILLDCRDEEAFEECHIEGAQNLPMVHIKRDHFPKEIYAFKNAKDKILVVYAEDGSDRRGVESAFLMFQKNFENVFLLTGGIKGFCEKYWGLVFGEQIPQRWGIKLPSHVEASSPMARGDDSPRAVLARQASSGYARR